MWGVVGLVATGWLAQPSSAHAKRPKLHRLEVASIAVSSYDGTNTLCLGQPTLLRITATLADGTVLDTADPQGLRLRDFEYAVELASVRRPGELWLENRGLELLDRTFRVEVQARRTTLSAHTHLKPRFDCPVALDYRGAPGASGATGDGGPDGSPSQPGGGGGGGGPGRTGGQGPALVVEIGPIASQEGDDLVLVAIRQPGQPRAMRTVVLEPPSGHLDLDVSGGPGGAGGSGGSGGDGGRGEEGTPSGGNGGGGGAGGQGGHGGPGGHVVIRYDNRMPELVDVVRVQAQGGPPGSGGAGGSGGSGGYAHSGGSSGSRGADGAAGASGGQGPPGVVEHVAVEPHTLFTDFRTP